MTQTTQQELASLIERFTDGDGAFPTAIGPLTLFRVPEPLPPASGAFRPVTGVFQPSFCVVAQGRKRVTLAGESYVYDTAHCLLMAVDLPVFAEVIEATPDKPCLSLRLTLDAGEIGALIMEADRSLATLPLLSGAARMATTADHFTTAVASVDSRRKTLATAPTERGVAVSPIDGALLDSVVRLLRLLETPDDIPILAPMAIREVCYRLLRSEHGPRLSQIARDNSHTQRIARAIDWLSRNFDKPVHIDDIAREANMSPAGLHRHFKAVTAMSPLQYQKQLRLQAARNLMLSEDLDAATAGLQVGYESPSQFSREYRRLFGAPPLRDLVRLRDAGQQESVPV